MKRMLIAGVGVSCCLALSLVHESGAQTERGARKQAQAEAPLQPALPPIEESQPGDFGDYELMGGQSVGPDVIVGDLFNTANHGISGGIRAYSIGTYSCNIGTEPLLWNPNTSNHPVIGQNLYRWKNGRFEQLGQSWVKHGFLALTDSLCDACQNPGSGQLLGVGCADPYDASLNGSAGSLGPKSPINAFTGAFSNSYPSPAGNTVLRGRIQVDQNDVDPTQNAGARYFIEGHYVTPDDAAWGNHMNNASWREVTINPTSFSLQLAGSTVRMQAAIQRWPGIDPGAKTGNVIVDGDGRIFFGWKVTDNGNGTWNYEYAIFNYNCDRSVSSFSIPVDPASIISNIGFRDVAYHSGDNIDGTDWPGAHNGVDAFTWSTTQTYVENPSANAIRWGTLYNFRFTVDAPPVDGSATLGLFKPAPVAGEFPNHVTIGIAVPSFEQAPLTGACCLEDGQCLATVTQDSCENVSGGTYQGDNTACGEVSCPQPVTCLADFVDSSTLQPPPDGLVDGADLAFLIGEWGDPGSIADIVDSSTLQPPPDGVVDGADLAYLIGNWGICD